MKDDFRLKQEEAAALIKANKENAIELVALNKEFESEHGDKQKQLTGLILANEENAFALILATNQELILQNKENEKRTAELLIANKELLFQNEEKEKRTEELRIANKELLFQNEEKEKRAEELIVANKALQHAEENFRRSISESPLGIRIVTVDEETIYVNKAFLDLFEIDSLEAYKKTPAIKRYTLESYAHEVRRNRERRKGHQIYEYEVSIIRSNGEIRFVRVWRKEVMWNGMKHFQVINMDITEQKRAEEALWNSQQELRKFAGHLQNVREEERKGLAREIHDDLGQVLVALKIDLGLLKKNISQGMAEINLKEIISQVDVLVIQINKTIQIMRRIMNGLRPEIIDLLGFVDAGKAYVEKFQEWYHLDCEFETKLETLDLNPEQSVALFRILQEALTNVAIHAKATGVKIKLYINANKLIMEIKDDGIGFNENQIVKRGSYGLMGMKERVLLLDGRVTISGKQGKGTCVKVEMPYSD